MLCCSRCTVHVVYDVTKEKLTVVNRQHRLTQKHKLFLQSQQQTSILTHIHLCFCGLCCEQRDRQTNRQFNHIAKGLPKLSGHVSAVGRAQNRESSLIKDQHSTAVSVATE